MASYKVVSNRLTIGEKDAIIDSKSLNGVNVEALLDAGHIVLATKTTKLDSEETKDK
jgi:hypothetical protein